MQSPSIHGWNFSYNYITFTATLDEWFYLFSKYCAKIEGDQPLLTEVIVGVPGLGLEKDKIEAEEGDDNEDVPAKLAKSVVVSEKLPNITIEILIFRGKMLI